MFEQSKPFEASRLEFDGGPLSGRSYYSPLSLHLCTFCGVADFGNDTLGGNVAFRFCGFAKRADFHHTQFDSAADFSFSRFNDTADFSYADFRGPLENFNGVLFTKWAVFTGTNFGSKADFLGANFLQGAYMGDATLPDTLDFRDVVVVGGDIDLTSTWPPRSGLGKCHIALAGADLDRITISTSNFELWFPTRGIGSVRPSRSQNLSAWDEKAAVYERLLSKFRQLGLADSYEAIDKQYQREKYLNKGAVVTDRFQRYWWDYGYSKWYIFVWTPVLWLLLSIITAAVYQTLNREVYRIEMTEADERQEPLLMRIARNSYQALIYTGVLFFSLKIKWEEILPRAIFRHWALFLYVMLIYAIGLLCIGFVVHAIFT